MLTALAVSGCIEEKETAPTPVLPDISQPGLEPGEFEIDITSYYFVYLRQNHVIHEYTTDRSSDLVEDNYVICQLAIKNNGTDTLNFSINKLLLHARDQVFTTADPGTIHPFSNGSMYVTSEIEKENKLNNTILHPDQTLRGIVFFQVDNTTFSDRSFSLRYNTTTIPSTSIEKSLEALTAAEQFDYSTAFDIPPYDIDIGRYYSHDFPESEHPAVWLNWVNKTVFESYIKIDEMSLLKEKPGNIPLTNIGYAVKVIPEQYLTVFHTNHSILYEEHDNGPYSIRSVGKYKGTLLYVVDDTGDELFNKSMEPFRDNIGLVVLDDQTYKPFSKNMPQMFIPRATVVHISFYSIYGWNLATRFTFNNQDIILDEQHNITLARYDFSKIVS